MIHTTQKYIQIVKEHGHPKGNYYALDPATGTITVLYNTGTSPVLLTIPSPPALIRECHERMKELLNVPQGKPIPDPVQVRIAHTMVKLEAYAAVNREEQTVTQSNS
jgi:hypothetical protein